MDTKSKNIKYSIFTKILCWLLAILLFSTALVTAAKIIASAYVFGPTKLFSEKPAFTQTRLFNDAFLSDYLDVEALFGVNKKSAAEYVSSQKETAVEQILGEFLDSKSSLIKSELTHAVETWDDTYYDYEGSADSYLDGEEAGDEYDEGFEEVTDSHDYSSKVQITEKANEGETLTSDVPSTTLSAPVKTENVESTTVKEETTGVSDYVAERNDLPKNIAVAQYALKNKSGRDFLEYESLVRESALSYKQVIDVEVIIPNGAEGIKVVFPMSIPLKYDEETARKYISEHYESDFDDAFESEYVFDSRLSQINEKQNFKFYISYEDGNVLSNAEAFPKDLNKCNNYLYFKNGNLVHNSFDFQNVTSFIQNLPSKGVLCVWIENDISKGDNYYTLYKIYEATKSMNVTALVTVLVLSIIAAFVFLVLWLCLIGKKNGSLNTNSFFIDKMPNDIHFILSFGLMGAYFAAALYVLYILAENFEIAESFFNCCFILPLGIVFFTEWLASVVRQKKCGKSFFKNTFIYIACKALRRFLKNVFGEVGYRPKYFKFQIILLFLLYLVANGIMIAFFVHGNMLSVVGIIGLIMINGTVGYCLAKYVKNLDKIIVASGDNSQIDFVNRNTVAGSLLKLADNLNDSNARLEHAVADAVKKEQMKTQLITNVSHDLKTPLTSLINYSELLKGCDIGDERAAEYIETLNTQSVKMKRLVEDLIEASKVSTGNVTLNKVKLNLGEMAVQAVVEFGGNFDDKNLELVFENPDEPVTVNADSTKTYRILSNLMSNAGKYSVTGTRVYVTVYKKDGYGCFEIKNISKEKLNISAEELTERFVRGDESRTNEGNGLGLSIAKDLCNLQNGILEISIDGDLFKAVMKLPADEIMKQ